jgi:hypothetical protein
MCYLRLLSTSTFRALRPSTSRTTDFCSPGCPDDIRVILPPDIEGRRTLTLTCSFALPRRTSAVIAARTTPAAASCSTSWALWCPLISTHGPKWFVALFAARKLLDRSLQSCTAQRTSSSLQPQLLPGTRPGFDNLSHWLRSRAKNCWVETVQSLPGDRGMRRLSGPQSCVLASLGFSPARVFPKDARF